MKVLLVVICIFFLNSVVALAAQDGNRGVGIIFGEPTGISGKLILTESNAIDAGVAWSFRRDGHLHIHADYLWQFPDALQASEQLTLFTGFGGRVSAGKGGGVIGLRLVGGTAWLPRNTPLEVFFEFAPILDLIPATEMSLNSGVGVRFFF
jgi:hypothetical protein